MHLRQLFRVQLSATSRNRQGLFSSLSPAEQVVEAVLGVPSSPHTLPC